MSEAFQQALSDGIKELIAIGASVTAHCQSCLAYHVNQARTLGVDPELIREAVTVGRQVEKGAMSTLREFSDELLKVPDTHTSIGNE